MTFIFEQYLVIMKVNMQDRQRFCIKALKTCCVNRHAERQIDASETITYLTILVSTDKDYLGYCRIINLHINSREIQMCVQLDIF